MKQSALFLVASAALSGAAFGQTTNQGEALACLEQEVIGFNPDEGTKRYRGTGFKQSRFTAVLKGDQLIVKINNKEEVYQCSTPWRNTKPDLIACTHRFFFMGLDLTTLSFTRGLMLGPLGGFERSDSLAISYGDCQRF